MLLIPAIDLKDGRCVRLKQGNLDDETVFSEDPDAVARHWLEQGAERLHLVDLNGAVAGKPQNAAAIKAIIEAVGAEVPVQLGGGIRSLETIERYLDGGVSYVIIGTAAVKSPGFLHDACNAFPGQVIVGLDARDGKVATDGWSKLTRHDVIDLARKFEGYGIEGIIYTDIGRDGMLTGINIEATVKLAQSLTIPVIASGGLSSIADIEKLCKTEGKALGLTVTTRQSNHEGELVTWIQEALGKFEAIIINPGAYSHTSVAIHDALRAVALPVIEVHLSNIHAREGFRHHSYVSAVATGVICGLGAAGYRLALSALAEKL